MKTTFARVLAALAVVAVLGGAAPLVAGAATAPKVTAKIDVHQALAGSQQAFTVTVSNPISGVARLTSVKIGAHAGLFTIAAPADAAGWTGTVSAAGDFVTFKAPAGGGIRAGGSQAFGFVADTLRPAADANAAWSVSTSSDPEPVSRYTAASPAAPGALGTRVRTLEVLDITVTAPEQLAGDDALHVTAGQDNVTMAVRVANAGSAAQTATVALTGVDATTTPETVDVPVGGIVSVPIDVAFGDDLGHGKVVASAVAGSSVAATRLRAYVAEPTLTYTVEDLRPWEVAPGTDRSFQALLTATGPDSPDVTLDPTRTELRLAGGAIVAPLTEELTLADSCCGVFVESDPTSIAADVADGQYLDVLHLEGVDEHGAEVDIDVPFDDPLLVDRDISTAEVELAGERPAAADGDEITFAGAFVDGERPCELCFLREAQLEVYDVDVAPLGTIAVDGPDAPFRYGARNEGGRFEASQVVEAWPEGARLTRLVATVVDPSGLTSTVASSLFEVDNDEPTIVSALTEDVRTVHVHLSEPVTVAGLATFPPVDWSCAGADVSSATVEGNTVVLALQSDIDPNATPTCGYAATVRRAQDRMGYELPDGSAVAEDNIRPAEPVVDAIEGRAADGAFHANTSTPTLSISDVHEGDVVHVYEELPDRSRALVGSATAGDGTVEITTSSLGVVDRSVELSVEAVDARGNRGGGPSISLNLDFTAPSLASASIEHLGTTRDVTVFFPEVMLGPAAADDWTAYVGAQGYTVSARSEGRQIFVLTVVDSRFQPQSMTIDGVRYDVFATNGSTRLTDRAGNVLADAYVTF